MTTGDDLLGAVQRSVERAHAARQDAAVEHQEEFAVLSADGTVYTVQGGALDVAVRERDLLRADGEPTAQVAVRRTCSWATGGWSTAPRDLPSAACHGFHYDPPGMLPLGYPEGLRWAAREIPPGTPYSDDDDAELQPGWWVIGEDPTDPDGDNGAPVLLYIDHAVDHDGNWQPEAVARALADILNTTRARQGAPA